MENINRDISKVDYLDKLRGSGVYLLTQMKNNIKGLEYDYNKSNIDKLISKFDALKGKYNKIKCRSCNRIHIAGINRYPILCKCNKYYCTRCCFNNINRDGNCKHCKDKMIY